MTDKKLTNNEIIKVLECCSKPVSENCKECPLHLTDCLEVNIEELTLDLITRQQTEILRLKSMNQAKLDTIHDLQVEIEQWKEEANKYQNLWCMAVDDIEKAKSEAVKEFAERLKNEINIRTTYSRKQDKNVMRMIDNLVKEMVGEEE